MMVIGAHSADFVWRAGGAVAVATLGGGEASVIALSYGERGESGELWKEDRGQTIENVKKIRHGEAERAAAALGASFDCLDLGDYPLEIDGDGLRLISDKIREFAPEVLITHTDTDPFNPDHPIAHYAVDRARGLAAGAGVSSAFKTIAPPALFLFEPHQPELCNFTPTTFVDITRGDREEARRDVGDEGAEVSPDLLRRARGPSRQPRAAVVGQRGHSTSRGVPAGHPQVVSAL